jgi:SPP1 gp7 family putative phage head morphogenesis protein
MGLLDLILGRTNDPAPTPVETKNVRGVEVKVLEIGTPGTEIYSGYLNEEYLRELQGKDWADKVDMMRRSDANIRMVLNAIKLPLKSSPWTISVREQSEEAELQKKLFEKILFEDMNKSFTQLLGEILTCLDFGYSIFDITHAVKSDSEIGSYNGLKSLGYRSQRTIDRWNLNDARDLETITQIAYGDEGGSFELDARFVLYFAPEREGDNFEGISILRACYGPWFRKNEFLKKLSIGIEKFAVPTAVLTTPEGVEGKPEFAAAKKALACYTSGATNYLILPKGYELDFNNVSVDVEKIRAAINAENQEMVNSILASFLLLGQNGAGSLALGTSLSDFFSQTIQYVADHISEQFERKIFKPLVQMNFGHNKILVDLKCDGLEHRANEAWASMVNGFIGTGAIKADADLEKNLREKLKLPPAKGALEVAIDAPVGQPIGQGVEQIDLQQQALNGAQIASLVEVIQKVAAGMLPRESAKEILQVAFQLDPAEADKVLGGAGSSFKIDPNALKQLAEKKKSKEAPEAQLIRDSARRIRTVGRGFLPSLARKYARSVMIQKGKANAANQIKAPINATVPGLDAYLSALRAAYGIASIKAKDLQEKAFKKPSKKLSEFRLATTKLKRVTDAVSEYEWALERLAEAQTPSEIDEAIYALGRISDKVNLIFGDYLTFDQKQSIAAKAEVFADTQKNDVVKAIDLQYQSSLPYVDDDQLEEDMMDAADKAIGGPMTVAGPDVQASQVVNQSLDEAAQAFEEETGIGIVSYTFVAVDDDATTDVCRELDGATFSPTDPDKKKYTPALHFNCRSFMQVNTTQTRDNPEITGAPKLTKAAQKQIQFSEEPSITLGGPGSGCRGDNCGRPKGSGSEEEKGDDQQGQKDDAKIKESAVAAIKSGKTTAEAWKNEAGEYREQRKELHQKILDEKLSKVQSSDKPIAILTGGGSGSGKTSVIEASLGNMKDQMVHVDADDIKKSIPEYNDLVSRNSPTAAAQAHDESSDLSSELINRSIAEKKPFLYDSTMKNKEKFERLTKKLKDNGYEVHIVFADCPLEEAKSRAAARARSTGRKVPDSVIEESHAGAIDGLKYLSKMADSTSVFSTAGKPPPRLAYSKSGKPPKTKKNVDLYNSMKKRGITL